MISANDAKQYTEKCAEEMKQKELSLIEKEIKKACEEGKRSCNIDNRVSKLAKDELNNLGYTIESGDQYNRSYAIIRW